MVIKKSFCSASQWKLELSKISLLGWNLVQELGYWVARQHPVWVPGFKPQFGLQPSFLLTHTLEGSSEESNICVSATQMRGLYPVPAPTTVSWPLGSSLSQPWLLWAFRGVNQRSLSLLKIQSSKLQTMVFKQFMKLFEIGIDFIITLILNCLKYPCTP